MDSSRRRFIALGGMRGLAASAVALFHFDSAIMPGGYLAVDFFFALSGFVLWRSYAERLASGLSALEFMRLRVIRLYPLFLTGIVLGAIFALQGIYRGSTGSLGGREFGFGLAFNSVMLPSPFSVELYPINLPSWSLAYELVANICLAWFGYRLGKRSLAAALPLLGLALLVAGWAHGSISGGDQWAFADMASLRTAFSFTIGMLVAAMPDRQVRQSTFWVLVLFAALCVALQWHAAPARLLFDVAFVFAISPILLIAGARFEPGGAVSKAGAWLGEISYALYAIHLPIAHAFQMAARALHMSHAVLLPVFLAVAWGLAWGCARWIDLPMRRWLTGRTRPAMAR